MDRTAARRALGAARIGVGAALGATILIQIVDLAIGGGLVPEHYFVFFTIDSSIIEAVVLVAAGIGAVRGLRSLGLDIAAAVVVPYGIVTGAVYNLVLRGMPTTGYQGMRWENEVVHVAAPLFLLLDWFLLRPLVHDRARLPWRTVGITAVFPLAWLAVTLVHGAATGWYPYPFLDPAQQHGWGPVIGWILGLTAAILALAVAVVAATRTGRRRAGTGRTEGSASARR
jgi:hypothetical protein